MGVDKAERQKLTGTLTPIHYFTLGFGAIVGVGWVALMGDWIKVGGGVVPAAIGFGLATILMLPIAFCYSELAASIPAAGGSIAYSYKAFGVQVSFWVGWFTLLVYVVICPWEAIAISHVVAGLFPALKVIPLYEARGYDIYLPTLVVGIVTAAIMTWANYRGVKAMAMLQKYLAYLLIASGVLVIVCGLLLGSFQNMLPIFVPKAGSHWGIWSGVFSVFVLAPFFLAGFDTIAQGAEEAGKISFNTLGKTVFLSMISAGIFYVLVIFAAGFSWPWQELAQMDFGTAQVFQSALRIPILTWIALLGALAGLLTTFNGFFYAATRVIFAMSRARLLPKSLAKLHPRFRTPYRAVLLVGMISFLGPFIGRNWLIPLADIGSVGFAAMYLGGALSAYRLRTREPNLPRPYRMPGGRIMAALAAACTVIIMFFALVPGLPSSIVWPTDYMVLLVWIILGGVAFVALSKERSSINEIERETIVLGRE